MDAVLIGADERLIAANGEAVVWPVVLVGDKGYRADWIDAYLIDLGITPVIPSKSNEDRDARPVPFDLRCFVIAISSSD